MDLHSLMTTNSGYAQTALLTYRTCMPIFRLVRSCLVALSDEKPCGRSNTLDESMNMGYGPWMEYTAFF